MGGVTLPGAFGGAVTELRPLSAIDERLLQGLYSDTTGPSLAFLTTLAKQPTCRAWVAEVEGQPAVAIWFTRSDTEVELIDIRVAESHRNRGFGARVLRRCLQALAQSGAGVCYLEVRESNSTAQHLYRRLGFVESGRRRRYYGSDEHREDAILMALSLEAMSAP